MVDNKINFEIATFFTHLHGGRKSAPISKLIWLSTKPSRSDIIFTLASVLFCCDNFFKAHNLSPTSSETRLPLHYCKTVCAKLKRSRRSLPPQKFLRKCLQNVNFTFFDRRAKSEISHINLSYIFVVFRGFFK